MKKVLLIQEVITHYRVDIFNKLAEKVDLTVLYSKGSLPDNKDIKFKTKYVETFKIRHMFYKTSLLNLCSEFDVVICTFSFVHLQHKLICMLPHNFKLIYWGIGLTAGYEIRYDSDDCFYEYTKNIMKKADALLFYCDYPKKKYAKMGIDDDKMFVANNTVAVLPIEEKERDTILFVGTLYKQKKIYELLENYYLAYQVDINVYDLVIVGDGEEKENIINWIKERRLENKITLTGGIYDESVLCKYFEKAIMCVSPDQAGLSVLKSMGYAVPYVTHKDAITGGEIFNIHPGIDGVLISEFCEIKDIISDSVNNRQKYIEMGKKAKEYYDNNRTVDNMVKGFTDAINYVTKDER